MKLAQAESNHAVLAGADLFGHYPAAEPQPKQQIPVQKQSPAPQLSSAKAVPPGNVPADLDEFDGPEPDIDLEPSESDSSDICIAKRMIDRMMDDLARREAEAVEDMFGHVEGNRETRKLDALIWMYDLNPGGSDLPFAWACDEIGLDPERIRNITARSVRQDLKRILKLLAGMVSFEYAKDAELKLSDYINLTGWNLN